MIANIIVVAVILVVAFFAFRKGFGKHGPKCEICSCHGCSKCKELESDLEKERENQKHES